MLSPILPLQDIIQNIHLNESSCYPRNDRYKNFGNSVDMPNPSK